MDIWWCGCCSRSINESCYGRRNDNNVNVIFGFVWFEILVKIICIGRLVVNYLR